jgi:hypothetical protein
MNPRLEPIDQFLRRFQDIALNRADYHPDEKIRLEAEAEALRLEALIGQFGRLAPR